MWAATRSTAPLRATWSSKHGGDAGVQDVSANPDDVGAEDAANNPDDVGGQCCRQPKRWLPHDSTGNPIAAALYRNEAFNLVTIRDS